MAYCSSYYLYQRYEWREGNADWIPSYPNVYSIDGEGSKPLRARQMYDTDCGWIPDTEVQYRTLSGTPYCTGYDLYVNKTYQVSYDGGITWETTGNEDALVERNSAECGYVPPPPMYRWVNVTPTSDPNSYWCEDCESAYTNQYLTFVAIDSGTFSFSGTSYSTIDNSSIEYSVDNGSTWNTLNRGVQSPTISAGQKIMWKSTSLQPTKDNVGINYDGIGIFLSTGRFNVEGNAMSLYYGGNFANKTSLNGKDGSFAYLFSGCTGLISAENLVLPATTLSDWCYYSMFYECSGLTTPPALPATTLSEWCYSWMFDGCTSLAFAPTLPATTLASHCYSTMFHRCASLTTAPQLPATTLAQACYANMFQDCDSLTVAPALPATNLTGAYGCYNLMFYGCNSLTTPPALPATTLANYCYAYMFDGCYSLTTAPELPATTLKETCYAGMFNGCSGLTTAPVLSAATLVQNCYAYMFQGCSSLNYVKCLATNISATDCTVDWLYGVSSSGTFVKSCNNYSWATGTSGIPSNWNVNCESGSYESQYLTFVALESGTFRFSGASSTTVNNYSIQYSLDNGSTWTTLNRNVASPTVTAGSKIMWKATFLSDYGVGIGRFNATGRYNIEGNIMSLLYGSNFVNNNSLSGYDHAFTGLFRGTSVVSAANLILPARTLRLYCYSTMFYGCSLLTSAPALPATTAADECYQSMFQNCTSLTTAPDLNTTNMGWGSCSWMFAGCTALTTPPALPATTMDDYCYQYMFSGCTSLTTSPTLPASTLVYMCYDRMFYGCRNLNYVRCYANTIAESSTIEWLYKVKSTGTFVKSPTMNSWERGNSGIPTNWTVQNP